MKNPNSPLTANTSLPSEPSVGMDALADAHRTEQTAVVRPFDHRHSVSDSKSLTEWRIDCRGMLSSSIKTRFVSVSFVANDWHVSPRRIRALLTAGRLLGFQGDNGFWQVSFPYQFTFGTRGPSLKRERKSVLKPQRKRN